MFDSPIHWQEFIERVGFPAFSFLIVLLGGWRIVRWIGRQVEKFAVDIVKPITDAHLNFVGSLDSTQKQLAAASQKQADAVDKISDTLEMITNQHGQKIDDIHAVVVMRKGGA